MATEFRTGVVGDEQGILTRAIRRAECRVDFQPDRHSVPGAVVARNTADGFRPLTRSDGEFKIHQRNTGVICEGDHDSPRSFLRTGWSRLVISVSRNATPRS